MAYDPNSTHNTFDPTEEMTGTEKFLAGAGKAFADPALRVKQLFGKASQADVDEAAARDAALMRTGAGVAGNIGGNVALGAIPGGALSGAARAALAGRTALALRAAQAAGPLTQAATRSAQALPFLAKAGVGAATGAAQGAVQPVTSDTSAAGNIGLGFGLGAAGQAVASGVGNLAGSAYRYAKPGIEALGRKAEELGIPVTSGQITNSSIGQAAQKFLGNLPFGGAQAKKEDQLSSFTKAVTGLFGEPSENAVTAVGNARNNTIPGSLAHNYEQLSNNNRFYLSVGDKEALDKVVADAKLSGGVSEAQAKQLQNASDYIYNQYASTGGNGGLPGSWYQGWRTELTQRAANNDGMADQWKSMRGILDTAMRGKLPSDQAALWNTNDQKYAVMKTVEKALPATGENANTGLLDPNKLSQTMNSNAAKNSFNKSAMEQPLSATGNASLADVTKVGNQFVPSPTKVFGENSSHLPFVDSIKSTFGPTAATMATSGAAGWGGAHLMPENSWAHEHPETTALGAALLGAGAGSTLGRASLSEAFKKGLDIPYATRNLPILGAATRALSQTPETAAAASTAASVGHVANSANAPNDNAKSTSGASFEDLTDPLPKELW